MSLPNLQEQIAFYKEKIAICIKNKSMIRPDDPYIDVKLKAMNDRIGLYSEELQKLEPDNLKSWIT